MIEKNSLNNEVKELVALCDKKHYIYAAHLLTGDIYISHKFQLVMFFLACNGNKGVICKTLCKCSRFPSTFIKEDL